MSIFSGTSGLAIFGAAGAAVFGLALWLGFARDAPDPEVPPALEEEDAGASQSDDAMAPAPKPEIEQAAAAPEPRQTDPADATPAPELPAPSFDEVRRESDGMTVIAGQGAPEAEVFVLLDGTELTATPVNAAGKFATLVMIAPDGKGHVLSLLQRLDGQEWLSEGEIILAPLDPPVVVAAVAPEPAVAPREVEDQTPDPVEEVVEAAEAAPETPDPNENVAETLQETSTAEGPQSDIAAAETTPTPEPAQEIAAASVEGTAPEETETVAAEPAVETSAEESAQPVETAEVPQTPQETAEAAETETRTAAAPEPQPEAAASTETQPETAEAPQTQTDIAEVTETQTQTAEAPAPAAEEVAILRTTEDGVELLNTAPPEVMDTVALDTISYSETGDVQLAGRAQPEAEIVRVYLDNNAIVTLNVDDKGRWRGDLPDVDEGIYTLRVDEVADDGSVISRVETPLLREDAETLAEAAAEGDGAVRKITVQAGNTLWGIASERYGDGLLFVKVFQANAGNIRDPDLIYPGQIFDLPD
ncbi:MAG: LysM peptidoglycan-binding domain-containing protein [Pseudomonadota bacterium]